MTKQPHWHGIALSADNKTIYASSAEAVFSWTYDPIQVTVSATSQTLITGMSNTDHTSRTLLMSTKQPGILIVSRGSADNIDNNAEILSSGHAQIRAFNVSNMTSTSDPYDYKSTGRRLGWGLRNSVGLAEEPLTGGIYSVENSADEVRRYGKDVHQDNPGEEMNFHGFLNSSTEDQGGNYGYPNCLAVWGLDLIQAAGESTNLKVGSQFVQAPNSTFNDTTCADTRVAPRLTFQAHQAPLDIIFEPDGSAAYVSFHGSW
jgi:glucose/arabinose dehydrogenase